MEEIWRDIPGFDGKYQASSLGRIKSVGVQGLQGCSNKDRILKNTSNGLNYKLVGLSKNKKQKLFLVHRIIWVTFNGPIPEGMEINHKNENRGDNRLSNLELLSHKDNINYGSRNSKCSKYVSQSTVVGNVIKIYKSISEAHKETGVCISGISRCCNGTRNSAGGFVWKYA